MNIFTGEMAAFGMLILIWTLLLVMVKEFKILPVERESFCSSYIVMAIGLGYLLLGSFFYNLFVGQASVLDYDVIWGFGSYGELLQKVQEGSVQGIFNTGYLLLARGVGTLFFKEYQVALIYVSFFLTLLTGLMLQGILKQTVDAVWQKRLWVMFFVLPYAHRFFLPSAYGLVMFCIVGAVWLLLRFVPVKRVRIVDNFYTQLVYGVLFVCMAGGNTVLYFMEMVTRG